MMASPSPFFLIPPVPSPAPAPFGSPRGLQEPTSPFKDFVELDFFLRFLVEMFEWYLNNNYRWSGQASNVS
jgi:hypothetical protein